MRRNKIFYIIAALAVMLTSCIKPFEPVIESNDAVKFVVSGQVTAGEAIQKVNVSLTSPIGEPSYIPVKGCTVKIIDGKGVVYLASEKDNGEYQFTVPQNEIVAGAIFKIDVVTPAGVNIVSDFDQVFDCPPVDSVYYQIVKIPTANPKVFIQGIQFYTDLNAENIPSHNFRWEGIETFEYHSKWPIEWYYDGVVHHVFPPDYSRSVCWRTALVKNIFTLSTENLSENKYKLLPLHFVDNYTSSRLVYGYSLLIKQYALSEVAYAYWDKMRINSNEHGGLYDKQPLAIKGNLHNLTHPDQEVLGFFGATTMHYKRISVANIPDLPILYDAGCIPGDPMRGGFKEVSPTEYPFYLYGDEHGYMMRQLDTECVDCLTVGGVNVKPDFWPF